MTKSALAFSIETGVGTLRGTSGMLWGPISQSGFKNFPLFEVFKRCSLILVVILCYAAVVTLIANSALVVAPTETMHTSVPLRRKQPQQHVGKVTFFNYVKLGGQRRSYLMLWSVELWPQQWQQV